MQKSEEISSVKDGLLREIEEEYERNVVDFQPWLPCPPHLCEEQEIIQEFLKKKLNATIGRKCFISRSAKIFSKNISIGHRTWIAAGAILRGTIKIGENSSVNSYAHIAGKVTIGAGVRIAAGVSIFGFNHGHERVDIPIYRQPVTSRGIIINDGVWIGANAVITDGVEIGEHSLVAGGAVVTKSFQSYQIIGGNPAGSIRDRRGSIEENKAT